ncbi:MAG: cytochrome b N-terminal domain-containing protein [Caldilineaceae bacterium]|nr:cytochrome b N-terminal domain-containing protein [Caldilineaceae bacterium]MCY4090177.1 cytochrome b N-terminal domain-containing protein [Caldilineaceae bacterium]MCY4117948.1 cytochrome b N-terminal domain-containing protein [Caldilineaceae bacterium]MDE0071751.1 cytochrome b N-terminal domain-containing protein [Caldilineaceae bacterium]MDE0179936.1 cytochrome b N-terminal domain-containing protein [Caldilineaceae bacterium]
MGVQQDIREKGLIGAVATQADSVFTRITAGIDAGEFRRMLQGDPPGRPNPRLKPHAESFLLHIKPTYYHESVTRFTHTFRLGLLSTYLFIVETITGILLMIWYAPTPERAYPDMILLLTNIPFGQFLRDMHRLGAEAMVAIVTLHMVRCYLTGSYKPPRQFTWFTGVLLLVFTLFLSFSGYLLPWDQLAFWAVTIGTSMAEAVPPAVVGEVVNLLARGAPDIGANGLMRFYLLHVLFLPLLLVLFFFVHYYKVVHFGISLPADQEEVGEDTANRVPADKRVYYLPDVFVDEMSFMTVITTLLILLTVFFFQAPLEHIANPQSTPLHTVAPWYFYWLQGLLKIADKFIAGVLLPGVLLVLLMAIPYLDYNPSRRGKDRKVAIVAGIVAGTVMIILSWMGTPEYAVQGAPSVEIVQDVMPEEGSGISREIGYKHLPLGVWRTDEEYDVHDHEFNELLHEFYEAVDFYRRTDPDFNAPVGQVTITQDQPGLKKLKWEIFWFDAQGTAGNYEKSFWLHEDSIYWEQYGWKHLFFDYVADGWNQLSGANAGE